MSETSIYADIAKRTGGDVYVGVVGPVRTGKSTFIRRFLDLAVLPNIESEYDRVRTQDEIPQSASGRTVMTTEPKFVPDESVRISVGGATEMNVKLVDCVGYMVDGALGAEEDGKERMVMTPWSDSEMPFCEAAELGTAKVIGEHATIAMLVTTDGSIAEIPRESYIPAEERVVRELCERGKPFAIILNSKNPETAEARLLAAELEEKYSAPVALVSCRELDEKDLGEIMKLTLGQFPIRRIDFKLPEWTAALDGEHPLRVGIIERIKSFSKEVARLSDVYRAEDPEFGFGAVTTDAGEGSARVEVPLSRSEYFNTLSELSGISVGSEAELFRVAVELGEVKGKYEKIREALSDAEEKGYGIVMPTASELKLEEPKLVKSNGAYAVKVTAKADSIHMIKTGIVAELCPVVGSLEQSEEVVRFITEGLSSSPEGVLDYNIFGKSLSEMVTDGMSAKLAHMPDAARQKLGETLGKIINEGSNGLICILL